MMWDLWRGGVGWGWAVRLGDIRMGNVVEEVCFGRVEVRLRKCTVG